MCMGRFERLEEHLGAKSAPSRAIVWRRHIQPLNECAVLVRQKYPHRPASIPRIWQAYHQDRTIRREVCTDMLHKSVVILTSSTAESR